VNSFAVLISICTAMTFCMEKKPIKKILQSQLSPFPPISIFSGNVRHFPRCTWRKWSVYANNFDSRQLAFRKKNENFSSFLSSRLVLFSPSCILAHSVPIQPRWKALLLPTPSIPYRIEALRTWALVLLPSTSATAL